MLQTSEQSPQKPLTSVTIELETGHFDTIYVFFDDDPRELAEKFIKKHQIDPRVLDLLTQKIVDAIENAEKPQKSAKFNKNKASKSFSEPFPNIFSGNLPFCEYFLCFL